MELERPKIVTVAVIVFTASLAYRIYGEVTILAALYPDPAEYGDEHLGSALVLAGIYAFQAWIIWMVALGRNWARIIMILLVLLRVGIAALILASPFAPIVGSPFIAVAHILAEVVAVILLLMATRFFRPHQDAA